MDCYIAQRFKGNRAGLINFQHMIDHHIGRIAESFRLWEIALRRGCHFPSRAIGGKIIKPGLNSCIAA